MNIETQVECANDNNFLTLEVIQKSLSSIDMRKEWIDRGITDAKLFLDKLNKAKTDSVDI